MNYNKTEQQSNTSNLHKRKRESKPKSKLQPKDYYVIVPDLFYTTPALTPTTIAVYSAIKKLKKNMPYCTPNYSMIKDAAGFRSSTTIAREIKVLQWLGVIKKERRGFKQSNKYQILALTDEIVKKLYKPYKTILCYLAEKDKKAKELRDVKHDLRLMKQKRMYIKSGYYKKEAVQSYPQIDEVHFMDTNVFSSLREENTISSNRYDQKIKIEQKSKGLTKIGAILPTKAQGKALLNYLQARITPVDVANSWAASRPPGDEYKPFGNEKLIGVTTEIALKLGDLKNLRSNIGHTHNIFKLIKPVGRTEADLVSMMYTALSLTQKHEGSFTTSPMAYLYSIVEYAFHLKIRKSPP